MIQNKVCQIIAAGRALVTAGNPAIRELLTPGPGVSLAMTGDASALAAAIREMRNRSRLTAEADLGAYRDRVTPPAVCEPLSALLRTRYPRYADGASG